MSWLSQNFSGFSCRSVSFSYSAEPGVSVARGTDSHRHGKDSGDHADHSLPPSKSVNR